MNPTPPPMAVPAALPNPSNFFSGFLALIAPTISNPALAAIPAVATPVPILAPLDILPILTFENLPP